MKVHPLLILLAVAFNKQLIQAQTPFAQANQTSTLFHPSFAGSKDKRRVSVGYSYMKDKGMSQRNSLLSFDLLIKRWGTGIGVYYLNQQLQKQQQFIEVPSHLTSTFPNKDQYNSFGIAIAPKYNIYNQNNTNQIKYTISPSLLVEYQHYKGSLTNNFVSTTYQSSIINPQYPDGYFTTDSVVIKFTGAKLHTNTYGIALGLQANSKHVVLMYKIHYRLNRNAEDETAIAYNKITDHTKYRNTRRAAILYSLDQQINAGLTLPFNNESNFSFTPIAGIGYLYYLNFYPSSDFSYYHYLGGRNQQRWHYYHLSTNIRIRTILFGAAYTHYDYYSYYGGSIGFQTSKLKVIANSFLSSTRFSVEVTGSILF